VRTILIVTPPSLPEVKKPRWGYTLYSVLQSEVSLLVSVCVLVGFVSNKGPLVIFTYYSTAACGELKTSLVHVSKIKKEKKSP